MHASPAFAPIPLRLAVRNVSRSHEASVEHCRPCVKIPFTRAPCCRQDPKTAKQARTKIMELILWSMKALCIMDYFIPIAGLSFQYMDVSFMGFIDDSTAA